MVAPSADFKKIKARVGKRAPAKANVTDTSFQSAALHVAPQSRVATAAASEDDPSCVQSLSTQRGLSLAQLQQQLRHPAAPVRLSAVKGLQNLLVRMVAPQQQQQDSELSNTRMTSSSSQQQQQQLPLLLTALAPVVWLDDDPDVRRAGRAALQTLLSLSSASDATAVIRPQAAYVTALVTTALHSLDGPQSLEAAGTVEWLAAAAAVDDNQCEGVEDGGWLNAAVPQWVPPLTRLLSADQSNNSSASSATVPTGSMRKKATGKSHNKKRKRSTPQQQQKNAATAAAPKQCALRAIHALLRQTSSSSNTTATSLGEQQQQPTGSQLDWNIIIRDTVEKTTTFQSTPTTSPCHYYYDIPPRLSIVESARFGGA